MLSPEIQTMGKPMALPGQKAASWKPRGRGEGISRGRRLGTLTWYGAATREIPRSFSDGVWPTSDNKRGSQTGRGKSDLRIVPSMPGNAGVGKAMTQEDLKRRHGPHRRWEYMERKSRG